LRATGAAIHTYQTFVYSLISPAPSTIHPSRVFPQKLLPQKTSQLPTNSLSHIPPFSPPLKSFLLTLIASNHFSHLSPPTVIASIHFPLPKLPTKKRESFVFPSLKLL
jgi:hypothetical protein